MKELRNSSCQAQKLELSKNEIDQNLGKLRQIMRNRNANMNEIDR